MLYKLGIFQLSFTTRVLFETDPSLGLSYVRHLFEDELVLSGTVDGGERCRMVSASFRLTRRRSRQPVSAEVVDAEVVAEVVVFCPRVWTHSLSNCRCRWEWFCFGK